MRLAVSLLMVICCFTATMGLFEVVLPSPAYAQKIVQIKTVAKPKSSASKMQQRVKQAHQALKDCKLKQCDALLKQIATDLKEINALEKQYKQAASNFKAYVNLAVQKAKKSTKGSSVDPKSLLVNDANRLMTNPSPKTTASIVKEITNDADFLYRHRNSVKRHGDILYKVGSTYLPYFRIKKQLLKDYQWLVAQRKKRKCTKPSSKTNANQYSKPVKEYRPKKINTPLGSDKSLEETDPGF